MGKTEKNDEKPKRRWVPQWLSFPLFLTIVAIVVIVFVQDNNCFKTIDNQKQIAELKSQIQSNLDSASYYSKKSRELNTNTELLEKVAREQYYMKRSNEDVYITDIK